MHPNPADHATPKPEALKFARARSFGVLAVSTDSAPLLAHVPFLLSGDGADADLHLVRSNPICRAAKGPLQARLDVMGPDGYVSPDWYGIDDQVPTWNYIAVSFTGRLCPRPVEDLEDLLAAQSAAYEARLPKGPWTMAKMSAEVKSRFLRMILPFRLEIESIDSTFKLGQNKDDATRRRAADALHTGFGTELSDLAEMMRNPPGGTE